jgi:purine-nucleoside phosphorylase
MEFLSRAQIEDTAAFLRSATHYRPQVMVITGSGLAGLAEQVESPTRIGYAEIPHFAVSTVEGHPGELVMGRLAGQEVTILQGRVHFYEGYSMQQITFPIRVLHSLGTRTLIVTNASGGLNPQFQTGDIMVITDHLNLVGMAGFSPLRGPNDPQLGPRFPMMAGAYDQALRQLAHRVAAELGFSLQEGIYIMLAGPAFETPADLRFLRLIGADAVGMSTVPEVTVARHAGMRVLGLSHISNVAHMDEIVPPPDVAEIHHEVLSAGEAVVPRLAALIRGVISRLDA